MQAPTAPAGYAPLNSARHPPPVDADVRPDPRPFGISLALMLAVGQRRPRQGQNGEKAEQRNATHVERPLVSARRARPRY